MTRSFNEQRAKGWSGQTKLFVNRFLDQSILLEPSPSGASGMQRSYQSSLIVLGVLVALVLLIACLNVANLLTAQAAARAREIRSAFRSAQGRGGWRNSCWQRAHGFILGATIGTVFAWWAAPFVVSRINPPDNPARLFLPLDLRVVFFGIGLTFAVTFLFGLIPALRASSVKPASALKGGEDPHSRRRLMYALIAAQVAFCFIVQFAAGLFVATFDRLAHQPTGFSSERVVVVDVAARQPQPPAAWDEVAEHLRTLPGVDKVAMAGWPLLSGTGWNGFIWVNGASTDILGYFLAVSPGWAEAMNLRFVDGRDLRTTDVQPRVAIVNEAFVRQCFGGQNPVGRSFEKETGDGVSRDRYEIVGVVKDARYRNMREPITQPLMFHFVR